jgi:hypothetical protein
VQSPGLFSIVIHPRVDLSIVGGGKNQCPNTIGFALVCPSLEHDLSAIGHLRQWLHHIRRHHRHAGALFDQSLHLAEGDTAAAYHQTFSTSNVEHHRVQYPLPQAS